MEGKGDKGFLAHIEDIIKGKELDTEEDKAVFWSNDHRPDEKGKFVARNQTLAEELAASKQGYTVIQNKADGISDKMDKADYRFKGEAISIGASQKAAASMSREFASRAKGEVTIYANYTGAGSFFRKTELPAIMENKAVTKVHYLDTNDKKQSATKEEWYAIQRDQWVDGRIEKLSVAAKDYEAKMEKYNAQPEAKRGKPPEGYAVGDFALEVIHAYENIHQKNTDPKGAPEHIDPKKERDRVTALREGLDKATADHPELRTRVLKEIKDKMANFPEGRAMLDEDFKKESGSGINKYILPGLAVAGVAGLASLPFLLGKKSGTSL